MFEAQVSMASSWLGAQWLQTNSVGSVLRPRAEHPPRGVTTACRVAKNRYTGQGQAEGMFGDRVSMSLVSSCSEDFTFHVNSVVFIAMLFLYMYIRT